MSPELKILLILSRGSSSDYKVLVRINTRELVEKVHDLVKENKRREAFDLVVREGEVEDYIPAGQKRDIRPHMTLIEDLL
jgi:hypothetical protein